MKCGRISGLWKENFVTIQKVAAKITSINLTRRRSPPCQPTQEPWHTPFPFSARIPCLPHRAVPSSICCSCLRLMLCPSHLLPSLRSSSSAFQKEQGQEFTPPRNLSSDQCLPGRPERRAKGLFMPWANSMESERDFQQTLQH